MSAVFKGSRKWGRLHGSRHHGGAPPAARLGGRSVRWESQFAPRQFSARSISEGLSWLRICATDQARPRRYLPMYDAVPPHYRSSEVEMPALALCSLVPDEGIRRRAD